MGLAGREALVLLVVQVREPATLLSPGPIADTVVRRLAPCPEKRNAADFSAAFHKNYPGGVLLSHAVAHAVSSAMKSLTAVFGMGTGVTSSL